jgi:glutamine cyclotransferase
MKPQRRPQRTILALALVALGLVGILYWSQSWSQSWTEARNPAASQAASQAVVPTVGLGTDSPLAPVVLQSASPLAPVQAQSPLVPTPPVVAASISASVSASVSATTSTVISATALRPATGVPLSTTLVLSANVAVSEAVAVAGPVTVSVQMAALPSVGEIPTYGFEVVAVYPHDPNAFTQGLHYIDGTLYEGTGLRGRSSLRRVELRTGEVLQQVNLEDAYFGEGIVVLADRIIQLTWQSNVAFVYDRASFARIGEFTYPTEGWGITTDGETLIMSDGSSTLFRRDPLTFAELGQVQVQADGERVILLNELEYIAGAVWANIWQTDTIAIIDPQTGNVVGWVDLRGLLDTVPRTTPADVLNGIAYDAEGDRLLITGKLWPAIFEIQLVRK